jgi:Zn finger protein HypA/HybF involved in hydrogenase expression
MSQATSILESEYAEAEESNTGWCTECRAFTRDFTEPDAENYDCPACGKNTVMGAAQALITGLIDFCEEED